MHDKGHFQFVERFRGNCIYAGQCNSHQFWPYLNVSMRYTRRNIKNLNLCLFCSKFKKILIKPDTTWIPWGGEDSAPFMPRGGGGVDEMIWHPNFFTKKDDMVAVDFKEAKIDSGSMYFFREITWVIVKVECRISRTSGAWSLDSHQGSTLDLHGISAHPRFLLDSEVTIGHRILCLQHD